MARKKPIQTDPDEIAITTSLGDSVSALSARYFPPLNEKLHYSQYAMKLHQDVAKPKIEKAMGSIFDTEGRRIGQGIKLLRKIRLIDFVQDPYRDSDRARMEAAIRRNHAIRTSFSVKEFFMFAEESEIIIELPKSMTHDIDEKDKQEILDRIKEKTRGTKIDIEQIIREAEDRDEMLKLEEKLPTFMWQAWGFGKAVILQILEDAESEEIKRLQTMNSRRLGQVIADPLNDMKFEGIFIDGQPVDRNVMIHGVYQEHQISPHTEYYGYSAIEPILHIAEGLNIFWEEDVKEIQRSAWLASIMLLINTAGLTKAQARTRIRNIVDAVSKPGKIIGISRRDDKTVEAEQLKLESDLKGLVELSERQETKIYKALQVPQFLVQAEDIATRATADKAASLFLEGPITKDQKWLSEVLEEQWYDPFLRQKLGLKEDDELPFKIKRVFKIPTVSEFIDLANAIRILVDGGVWDAEQANKILKTPEVNDRIENNPEMVVSDPKGRDMSPFGNPKDISPQEKINQDPREQLKQQVS